MNFFLERLFFKYSWVLISFFSLNIDGNAAEMEKVRLKITTSLIPDKIDEEGIRKIFARKQNNGSFNGIDYSDLSRLGKFPHRKHLEYMLELARGYRNEKSIFWKNTKVLEAIISAYRFWIQNDFKGDNWHNNQITTPRGLVDLMLLVGSELPQELIPKGQEIIKRGYLDAWGARPSGDRIAIAGTQAKNALFMGDVDEFKFALRVIEEEMKFSTGNPGLQHDHSFHHRIDRVNSTCTYGYKKFFTTFCEWSHFVSKTEYEFSEQKIKMVVDFFLDGICKQQVYGTYTDVSVINRSISKNAGPFAPHNTQEVERLLESTNYRSCELKKILFLRKKEKTEIDLFSKFFWQSEHFVFQRPHFYTSVRMFSVRNKNMEHAHNGVGKYIHHRGDGVNHLHLNGDEYHNLWPVYDWQKIPGTTVSQKPTIPHLREIQKESDRVFVGAVSDGKYGAVAFDFKSPHDGTEAKKSWFFFDQEYVCLGSGIHNGINSQPIVTTIDQTRLRGSVTASRNNSMSTITEGDHSLHSVNWVHHHDVGYFFPNPSDVNILNQVQTGRWSDITNQKNTDSKVVKEPVFLMWLDHEIASEESSYEYIVIPNITLSDFVKSENINKKLITIANSEDCQGVYHNGLGIFEMIFYKPKKVEIESNLEIELYTSAAVMMKLADGKVTQLSVSDPSRNLKEIVLSLTGEYQSNGIHAITQYFQKKNETLIKIKIPQGNFLGQSVTIGL